MAKTDTTTTTAEADSAPKTPNTITISCRLPSGIVLDLYDQRDLDDFNKAPKQYVLRPKKSIKLNGIGNSPFYKGDNRLLGLAGKTEIDKDFWDAYKKQNTKSVLIKENIIFADNDTYSADDHLKDFATEKTGLESLDPSNPTGKTGGSAVTGASL